MSVKGRIFIGGILVELLVESCTSRRLKTWVVRHGRLEQTPPSDHTNRLVSLRPDPGRGRVIVGLMEGSSHRTPNPGRWCPTALGLPVPPDVPYRMDMPERHRPYKLLILYRYNMSLPRHRPLPPPKS